MGGGLYLCCRCSVALLYVGCCSALLPSTAPQYQASHYVLHTAKASNQMHLLRCKPVLAVVL